MHDHALVEGQCICSCKQCFITRDSEKVGRLWVCICPLCNGCGMEDEEMVQVGGKNVQFDTYPWGILVGRLNEEGERIEEGREFWPAISQLHADVMADGINTQTGFWALVVHEIEGCWKVVTGVEVVD